jgi:TnpA family transposase
MVTASAMLKRLSACPRVNGLAVALREVGRLERSIFMLTWLRDVDLRRRTQGMLNKGEARIALARAAFFCQPGELRDRTFENQSYRASGLNLVVAAVILWNARYLQLAADDLASVQIPCVTSPHSAGNTFGSPATMPGPPTISPPPASSGRSAPSCRCSPPDPCS